MARADVEYLFDLTAVVAAGLEREAHALVETTAELIADVARHHIQDPPKTGTIYTHGPPPLPHQSSAPGESPANWTGELAGSIKVEHVGPLESLVEVLAEHGAALEFGSTDGKVAPRPFLDPSVEEVRPLFEENAATLVERAAR